MPEIISHTELLSTLSYDPQTGIFTWLRRPAKNVPSGGRAGTVGSNGHRIIGINFRDYTAQRLAWFYVHGVWPQEKLKHEDGNKDNNSIANLIPIDRSGKFKGEFDMSPEGRAAYNKAHRARFADHYRDKDLQKNFGITLEQYKELLVEQKGVCAICGQPETATRNGKIKMLAVDHDHETGAIRSLLCGSCNPMIGYAKDDPARLRAAADYLEQWAEKHANIVPLRKDAS